MIKRNTYDATKARMDLLKKMDDYLVYNVGDDIYYDIWAAVGLEDGGASDPDILREYAEDEAMWFNCVREFFACLKAERER